MQRLRSSLPSHKPIFAKRVADFANRAMALPGFPAIPVCSLGAIVLTTVVGAFGTGAMPIGVRVLFWTALIGTNAVIWQAWFALTVRRPRDWTRSALLGAVLINAPLPLEISLILKLFGIEQDPDLTSGWTRALAISAVIIVLALTLRARQSTARPASAIKPGGLLAKAGAASPDQLLAIRAEDHYCRAFLADGRSVLIHHRFSDAVNEMATTDGAQVHRSAWIANIGVARAERNGRSWRLLLPDGTAIPVSAKCAPLARERGWLSRAQG
ncbi:MAG TPA: LytTR family DNA-binding domain-containing protein [Novosphingobium sp.]|nr:LytTR family DNA-binding domain-containing protein [Novosphingobium sp.]